jgi:transcriptional regulator with XRE-family HTH domain
MGKSINCIKLHRLIEGLSIPVKRVAQLTGVSQATVSRIISPRDPFEPSAAFLISLERAMGRIIDEKRVQYFEHVSITPEEAESLFVKERK